MYFQRQRYQPVKITLHLKRLAFLVAGKGGRIENDDVKLVPASSQPRHNAQHIVRNETVSLLRIRSRYCV